MKAIITRKNKWGEFDSVGMNNRYMTSHYKTEKGLVKYGIAEHFKGEIRIELFRDSEFLGGKPYKIFYVHR